MNKDAFTESMRKLEQRREELRLQMHLARAELKEEWEATEKRMQVLQQKLAGATEKARTSSREVAGDLRIIAEEIGSSYERIRNRLQKDRD